MLLKLHALFLPVPMSATWPLCALPYLYDVYVDNSSSVWLRYKQAMILSPKTVLKSRLLRLKASGFFSETVSYLLFNPQTRLMAFNCKAW